MQNLENTQNAHKTFFQETYALYYSLWSAVQIWFQLAEWCNSEHAKKAFLDMNSIQMSSVPSGPIFLFRGQQYSYYTTNKIHQIEVIIREAEISDY